MWRDPMEELRNIERRMNRLFAELLRGKSIPLSEVREPPADLVDTGKEIKVSVELPGVKREDIKISATERELEISAEVRHEQEKREGNYVKRERSYRSFRRSFVLPAEVDPGKARATYRNGVLEITLPRLRQERKSIKVE